MKVASNHNVVTAFRKLAGPYSITESRSMATRTGLAFNAVIWHGARRLGTVECQGRGDMVFFRVAPADLDAIKAHAEAVLTEEDRGFESEGTWIAYILDYMEHLRKMRKIAKYGDTLGMFAKRDEFNAYGMPEEVIIAKNPTQLDRYRGHPAFIPLHMQLKLHA